VSIYQAFCIVWYLDRGDVAAARLCAILPSAAFAFGDAMMHAAFVAGATEAARG